MRASVDVTSVVFTVFAFGWLILPLLAFGLDATLDPATLALYPLRTRPLAVGLLAASATGAWPLANVVGLLGVTIGLARGAPGVVVAVVAVLLQVLFCITAARFVTTALAGLLRSRRGKDFAALLILPVFALYEAFAQVVPRLTAEGKLTTASFAGVDGWLRWVPPGLAPRAIQDASDGHPGTALLRLALLAAVIVVAASVSTIRTPSYLGALLGSAGFGAAFIGVFHANSIGMTGPAFGVEAMALTGRRALRGYFSGQNVALGIIAVPLLTAISFGLAAVAGHPADGFLGMAVDLAGVGAGLALSNIFTVALPYPAEKRAGNPTPRAADGYMGHAIAGVFGSLFGVAVAVTPVVLAAVLTRHDPAAARIPLLLVCAAG